MMFLKNRHNLMLLASLLMFCVLLSSPAIASTQSVLQDDGPLLPERNWAFADLGEYPITINNLEAFIDQLSDLHNESDIGTHSNPAAMQALDGIYNTLTSDNVTIPEQPIYDPETEEFLYNQNAYESWRLDLEGGWIDVDHDEISAEICVYGGTQAEESLKVDIWDNDGWINVIPDVMPGWNNVSIAPSIVDKTLEMRFTGSNTGNTSVQSSWDIDAILLHTWTTVYGSEFTQNGIIQDLGNGFSRYIASVGETNTWNEVNETWHRYLYDPDTKTVQVGNLTITHLPRGDLSIDGDAGSRVGKLSWFIQAYYGDQWDNITLGNYQFVGFSKTADNVTAHQRFWGTQGEMNVYLTYSYFGGFKTRVDIRNDAAQAVPIRAVWAARDISGIQDNYELLYNEDGVLYGIQIEDAAFSWYDVLVSDNPLPTQTVVDKPNRRAAVIFGNQSTVIPVGYTATIDPSYYVAADADDNYWDIWDEPVRYDSATNNKIQTDGAGYYYVTTFRMALTIAPYSTVTQASLAVFVTAESGANSVTIQRINALSAAVLEGGSYPSIDTSPTGTVLIAATDWATSDDIGDLVQEQINQAGWTGSNQYMGFMLTPTGVCGHTIYDYQATAQVPYLTVTFEAPAANWLLGYGYRQGHSIDGKTGAGTLYPIEVAVEYGAGTSEDGTIYANEHCDTDFDDIRFTDNDGQTELSYWMEEKTDSDDATFWVEVTDDLGSDQVIYCYYGKSGDSTTSDGDATFIAFDDFEDNNLDKWIGVDPTYTATQSGTVYAGTYAVFINPPSTASKGMSYNFTEHSETIDYSVMMNYQVRVSTTAKVWYDRLHGTGGTGYDMVLGGLTSYVSYYTTVYARYPNNVQFSSNTWLEINHAILPSGSSTQRVWESGDYCGSINYGPVINNPDLEYVSYSVQKALDGWMDNFYVRKWVATEPAHYTWGREQVAPNNPPTVEPQPTVDVLDDTDKLYSRLTKYEVTTYHKDLDGYDDINYVQFYVYNEARDTVYFYGRFVQSTQVFSEEGTPTQESYWELDTGGSTHSEHDIYYLDVTWKFWIEWASPDVVNLDVRCYVIDAEPESDSLYYDYLWDGSNNRDSDIETDLDWSSAPAVTDDDAGTVDRGDLNEAFTMEGTLKYQGSALVPPDTDVDVWVSSASVASSPWSDLLGSSGTYTVTCYADDVVGSDDFTMKPVANNGGSGGASLYYTTDLADAYIADRAEIYSIIAPDDHVGAGTGTTIQYYIRYDYLDQAGVTGTFTTDTTNDALVYQSGDQWDATVNEPFGVYTFNGFTTCTESQHGLTGWTFTGSDESIDFDTVRALAIEVSDDRCSYGSNQWVQVRFDYQSTAYGYVTSWGTTPTITGPNGVMQLTQDIGSGWWRGSTGTYSSVAIHNYNTNTLNDFIDGDTILSRSKGTYTDYTIWDRVNLTLISNLCWTIIGYNTTLSATGVFEYDSSSWSGVVTWTDRYPSESTVGSYDYGTSRLSSITDPDYGVTVFDVGEEATAVFDDIVPSGSVAYYWTTPTSPNLDSVNLIWGAGSNWMWDYNDTLLNIAVIFTSYSNGTAPSGSGGTYGSGAFGGLTTGLYSGTVWDYVDFTVDASVTIDNVDYEWEIWSVGMAVVVPHSLTTSVWFFYKDGDYYQLLMHSNYENASVMVWDDMTDGTGYGDSTYYADYEGMHEWLRDTTVGIHNCTILLNAGEDKGTVDRNYVENDLRLWYNFTYSIAEPSSYDCHIVILDNLFELVPFDTFEVYKNDSRIYHDVIQVVDGYAYKITVKNRFGDTVNETTFDADFEMVVFVNTYSFKFMNWYNGFLRVNVTRGGAVYSEIIMPMEIIEFNLFEATYTFSVDFLNGTTKFEQEVEVTNSTGYVITGDSLTDVFDLVNSVWDMTTSINITVTSTNNYALTISIDLININTTIGYQLVQVLLNITNTNTTIYSQVVDLLAYLQNVNSTLFDQTVDIIIELNYISSNVTAGFISVAATLSAIDSNLYSNFTSVAATLVMLDSSLLSNFTEISATLLAINSNLISNFTYVLANLTGIGSNITANYLSVSAALSAIDSSLLANFTSVSATLTMIDSQLLSNFTELTAELLAVNSTIAAQVVSVAATLLMLDSSLLSNFTSVSATLSMLDSQLLSNFTAVTSTLSAIGSNITAKFLSVSATLSMIDSSLLANFTSITATLSMIDSALLSNFTELTAELLAVNSTIATQFLSVAATLSLLDSSLLSNFTAVSATLSMIDSSLLSNFTAVTSTLSAIGSNVTSNYLSVSATLSMIDSQLLSNFTDLTAELLLVNSSIATQFLSVSATLSMLDSSLLSNFTSVTATLSAIGTNITTNYLSVVATLSLIDSQLASNFTYVVSQLLSVNSSIASQFITIISNVADLNATIFLVDDPTHLNPLVLGYSLSDDYCDFTIVTTWHNASVSIYDNDVLRAGPTSELLSPIRYPLLGTSGTHNLSLYIDAGADSFWYNISYTVAEIIAFEVEEWDVTPHLGVENYLEGLFRTTWGNSTIYVYMNETYQVSVSEQEGGASFMFWMSGISGLHNYVFNVTSGTNVITITWDFYLPDWADTGLVVRWDMWTFQNNYTMITLESNWMNCTYYLYLNDSLVATSYNDPVTLNFTRSLNNGTYNLTIYADGGISSYTIKNIRYIVTEEGVSYDFSSFSGGVTNVEGDTYEGDNVTINENPTGVFIDQATAAIVAVGSFLIIFTAFLVARELKHREREKTERTYSQ